MIVQVVLDPAQSSTISQFTWDARTEELVVQFKTGNAYMYHKVTRDEFVQFIQAESFGKFFTQRIRSLPFTKVDVVRTDAKGQEGS